MSTMKQKRISENVLHCLKLRGFDGARWKAFCSLAGIQASTLNRVLLCQPVRKSTVAKISLALGFPAVTEGLWLSTKTIPELNHWYTFGTFKPTRMQRFKRWFEDLKFPASVWRAES